MTTKFRGYIVISLSAVLFGTYGIWSSLMGSTFAPFYQAWVRSIVIVILLFPFLIASRGFRKIDRQDWPAFGLYILCTLCTQVPLYYAFNHASVGVVQLIFYASFVVTAYVVGKFYIGEDITRVKLAAMALALVGLAIVFSKSISAFSLLGLALAGLDGVASGGQISSSKRVSDKYSPLFVVFVEWVAIVATHMPLSLMLHERLAVPAFTAPWLWLMLYALTATAAFWLAISGFRHVDASIGSLLGLTETIFAVIFAAIFLRQGLTWLVAIGGAFILAGGMLSDVVNLIRKKRVPPLSEPIREV